MKTEYEEVTKLKVSKGVHVRQDVRPHGPPREQVGRPLINGVTGSDRAWAGRNCHSANHE